MLRSMRLLVPIILIAACGLAEAQAVPGCGNLSNAYGPFDYRDFELRAQHLAIVENRHFTPTIEALKGSPSALIDDIDYTLRAWPNHHRALNTVGRYELVDGRMWKNPDVRSAACYFKRAIVFAPDDEVVRMLYANFLTKKRDRAAARSQYEEALRLAPANAEINYNAGLFFVDEGDVAKARELAAVAYGAGYPLPGLKNKLSAADSRTGQ